LLLQIHNPNQQKLRQEHRTRLLLPETFLFLLFFFDASFAGTYYLTDGANFLGGWLLGGYQMPTDGTTRYVLWHGRLDEVGFLNRIYKLADLPSYDHRYKNAEGDIRCHTGWNDWPYDWVFTDERFHLIDGDDENFLTFICEVFHPAVTKNSSEDEHCPEFYCLKQISDILRDEGYELYELKRMGNKPVIAWKDIGVAKAVIDEQAIALRQVFDSDYMQQQIHQMQTSVDTNPSDAIGKAKELIESCCKTILENKGVTVDKNWDVPRLGKETFAVLNLLPNNIANSVQGEDTIKKFLGNLISIPSGVAELRNPYGSGHGKSNAFVSLEPRHARLAVGAATSLCSFLWETYEANNEGIRYML
jgi:hypothetical protein